LDIGYHVERTIHFWCSGMPFDDAWRAGWADH